MSGESADEFVRLSLNGLEVAVRLTGSAAKNLAAILVAWAKKEKKVYGKTNMTKLLNSNEELDVISMPREQYTDFRKAAKNSILYSSFANTKTNTGTVEVVFQKKAIPLMNHILKQIGYGTVKEETEIPEESKKKDTPSKQNSDGARLRSNPSRNSGRFKAENRESVVAKLEKNKSFLEQSGQNTGKNIAKKVEKGR